MKRLLIVDDDAAMRRLLRLNLSDHFEIVDTDDPGQSLALAMTHKPDAILMDLRMPNLSGFDLCRTLSSYSKTQSIPIYVVSGETGDKTKEYCRELGAAGYFEKPIDFEALNACLARVRSQPHVPRSEVRLQLKVPLKLKGKDIYENDFEETTSTINVSMSGFLCGSAAALQKESLVDVYLLSDGGKDKYVGKARTVRSEAVSEFGRRYGFRFTEKTGPWILE
jgi:DNA-binding response OmpR family regulator